MQRTVGQSCLFFTVIVALGATMFLMFLMSMWHINFATTAEKLHRENNCNIQIVESIPYGLNYSENDPKFTSTYNAWKTLLEIASDSVNIGSFYWTLRGADVVNHSSASLGEDIFNRILSNKNEKKLKIRIVQSIPTPQNPDFDTKIFEDNGAAEIRSINFTRLLGNGVLHTKVWIVDDKHFYLGSANMDWRSLTQVKELGVIALNCASLTSDVAKIFDVYWYLGLNTSIIPKQWPEEYSTKINWENPIIVKFNNSFQMSALFSNSPPPLSPSGRLNDLESILKVIASAEVFINIAVMDYLPLTVYTDKKRYWPYIEDAIKTAAIENKISIKMLISLWPHSMPAEDYFLRSLSSLSSSLPGVQIEIKRFTVPSNEDQSHIPYSRVNHNKYMVTDNAAYIGTSNWEGDYFTDTAGIGLVLRDIGNVKSSAKTVRTDLLSIFVRDWESPYSKNLLVN